MCFLPVKSDQLYTWSDINGKPAGCYLEKTSPSASAPVAPAQGDLARLADRALQTLRQARVQMRRRSGPWPQVLPFGEPPGLTATNGLCAARVSRPDCRIRRQLSPGPRDLRSDLRDQPRTDAPPGGTLSWRHERSAFHPPITDRCWIGRRTPCEYGRGLARCQPGWCDKRGGSQ
jgi:hypothetical protein